jgi:hypothetical protein
MEGITVNKALRELENIILESEVRLAESVEHENWREITHLSAYLAGLKQAMAVFELVDHDNPPTFTSAHGLAVG